MTHSSQSSAKELSDTERNTSSSEVPMPEQKTGDVPTPDKETAKPLDNPPAERA